MQHREGPPERMAPDLHRELWWRSLTLQGSWNDARMQSLGLLFTLLPWLRRQRWQEPARRRFLRRHLAFFNTNPYCAGIIVGGIVRLEQEGRIEATGTGPSLADYKSSLARALASLGDQLFWLGLHPALLVLTVLLAWWGGGRWTLVPVGLFGAVQLVFRYRQVAAGHAAGLAVPALLARPGWHRAIAFAKRSGALLTGLLLVQAVLRLPRPGPGTGETSVWIGFACCLVVAGWARRRWPGEVILLLMLPLAVLFALSGGQSI